MMIDRRKKSRNNISGIERLQQPHAKILADANKLCFPAAKDFSRIPKLLYPKLSEAA